MGRREGEIVPDDELLMRDESDWWAALDSLVAQAEELESRLVQLVIEVRDLRGAVTARAPRPKREPGLDGD